jgi:hypothetical protein
MRAFPLRAGRYPDLCATLRPAAPPPWGILSLPTSHTGLRAAPSQHNVPLRATGAIAVPGPSRPRSAVG